MNELQIIIYYTTINSNSSRNDRSDIIFQKRPFLLPFLYGGGFYIVQKDAK